MDSRANLLPTPAKRAQRLSAKAPRSHLTSEAAPGSSLTRRSGSARPTHETSCAFWLKPIAPFRLELTVWALRRRPSNLIDRWDAQTYRRVLVLDGKPVEVAVTQKGPPDEPRLRVSLTGQQATAAVNALARGTLERLLGLRLDLSGFYRLAARDRNLGLLVERFRGVKPPRFPTLFEALANAIACQQMSLSLGILLLSRLTERFGLPAQGTASSARAFPRPEDLAGLQPEVFREMGFSRQKGRSLIALAQEFSEHSSEWEALEALDNQAAVERLLDLRGVGRWSAEYALLRGLGRLGVYPGDDVGARNNLQRWLRLRKPLDYEGLARITAQWQPYAGLVYFHMLLDHLAAAGHLGPQYGAPQPGGAK